MNKVFLAILIGIICIPIDEGKAQVGTTAPDFTVTDTHGETHRLYDYLNDGKFVILDFFFTTCGPCIYYSPQVNLAYEKYGCNSADVVFIAIDFDDTNAEVIAYDEEYGIEYPSISGKDGGGNAVVNAYNVLAFPTFYVIDSTKTIVHEIDPPTLQVFDYYLPQFGIEAAPCLSNNKEVQTIFKEANIHPNPVSRNFITVSNLEPGEYDYSVYFSNGKLLFKEVPLMVTDGVVNLDLDLPAAGFYHLSFKKKDNKRVYHSKVVRL
jgi:thiol-disulfide isomerase/thioredoxin